MIYDVTENFKNERLNADIKDIKSLILLSHNAISDYIYYFKIEFDTTKRIIKKLKNV